uniref:hypothetical protein n=1 Tax=Yoonia sp. TaxID=2212373 RepID=UPI00404821C4
MLKIGTIDIALPRVNKLVDIYARRPTYDYLYWNIIRAILAENGVSNPTLIDVGANIGDTIAHFRRFSTGPAIGVEPDDEYFDLLAQNMSPVANVTAIKALVCPDNLMGDVSLMVKNGTGGTVVTQGAGTYHGPTLSVGALLARTSGPLVFKTDTDGFDQVILGGLLAEMRGGHPLIDIIAFEGPTQQQMGESDYNDFLTVVEKICALGYRIIMLSNVGAPLAYPMSDFEQIRWQMNALTRNLAAGIAATPYFDFIAVRPDLSSDCLQLTDTTIWTDIHPPSASTTA